MFLDESFIEYEQEVIDVKYSNSDYEHDQHEICTREIIILGVGLHVHVVFKGLWRIRESLFVHERQSQKRTIGLI